MRDNQFQQVYGTLLAFLKKNSVEVTSSLKDDLCLDSLDIVELMAHLEKKFGIEFEGETLPRIETIGDLTQHTCDLINQKSTA